MLRQENPEKLLTKTVIFTLSRSTFTNFLWMNYPILLVTIHAAMRNTYRSQLYATEATQGCAKKKLKGED